MKAPSYKISVVTGGLAALIFAFSGLFVHDGAVTAPWGGGAVESTAPETAPMGVDADAENEGEDKGEDALSESSDALTATANGVTLSIGKDSYIPGETITVTVTGVTPEMIDASAFAAIFNAGDAHEAWQEYHYPRSGDDTLAFTAPNGGGNYEMRLYNRDHVYTDETFVVKVAFTVNAGVPADLSADDMIASLDGTTALLEQLYSSFTPETAASFGAGRFTLETDGQTEFNYTPVTDGGTVPYTIRVMKSAAEGEMYHIYYSIGHLSREDVAKVYLAAHDIMGGRYGMSDSRMVSPDNAGDAPGSNDFHSRVHAAVTSGENCSADVSWVMKSGMDMLGTSLYISDFETDVETNMPMIAIYAIKFNLDGGQPPAAAETQTLDGLWEAVINEDIYGNKTYYEIQFNSDGSFKGIAYVPNSGYFFNYSGTYIVSYTVQGGHVTFSGRSSHFDYDEGEVVTPYNATESFSLDGGRLFLTLGGNGPYTFERRARSHFD